MKDKIILCSAILVVFSLMILPGIGYTLPSGEEVVPGSGSATFDRSVTNTLNVNQGTDRVIIDYHGIEGVGGFSIASGETVNFLQPASSSIALNRVVSGNPSEIFGALNANGHIFLVNPSGILFGAGSQVDTAGLIASTLNINNADFLAENYNFYNSVVEGTPGTLVNSGTLSAPGGFVALLGVNVENTSTGIITDVNSVALASGNALTVALDPDNIINVVIDEQASVNPESKLAGVINAGQIKAGSKVLLTAGVMNGIFDNAINNSGIIEARDIVISGNGNIALSAGIPGHGAKASASSGSASVKVESTEGNIDISNTEVSARIYEDDGVGGNGDARIDILAGAENSKINIQDSKVEATVAGKGDAEVDIDAFKYSENGNSYGGIIKILNSSVLTTTSGGDAEIFLETGSKTGEVNPTYINIAGSSVVADVNGQGHAGVYLGSDYGELDLGMLESIIGVGDLTGLLDLSSEDDIGGPIYGPITVTGSTLHAESEGSDEYSDTAGTAVVAMAAADDLTISDSTVSAQDPEIAEVALYSEGDILINTGSTLSATTTDGLAGVVGLAYGSLISEGKIVADGGEGFGLAALLAEYDLLAANVSAKGNDNVIPLLENLLEDYLLSEYEGEVSFKMENKYAYGSGILLASLDGDVTLGDLSADAVVAAALGGSIYDLGDVNAHLLLLLARGSVGSAVAPVRTNVDILAAYSGMDGGSGDIYVQEANGLELGLYLPILRTDSEGDDFSEFLGMSTAANDGIVHVVSGGDMVVNSVISSRGGVFLQSTDGSIYAGNGWNSAVFSETDPISFFGLNLGELNMDVTGTDWDEEFEIKAFAPIVYDYPQEIGNLNVIAGGYSYFSSLEGTIGVGSIVAKDSLMSGGIQGVVRPGVEAVTGVYPSSDFDLIYGPPHGLVQYDDMYSSEGPQQIWPATLVEGPLSFDNPLQVYVEAFEGSAPAVRDGFVPQAGLTLQFGSPIPSPVPEGDGAFQSAGALNPTLRAYYEIMKNYRVASFEPATPMTFFGYHPLTPMDMSAFDGIVLDAGAYEFISDSIKMKKNLAPYFGQ